MAWVVVRTSPWTTRKEHQSISKPRPSKFPPPSGKSPGAVPEDSSREGNGKREGNRERKRKGKDVKAALQISDLNPNEPTHDQLYLAEQLHDLTGRSLSPAAIVDLNKAWGRTEASDVMRSVHGSHPALPSTTCTPTSTTSSGCAPRRRRHEHRLDRLDAHRHLVGTTAWPTPAAALTPTAPPCSAASTTGVSAASTNTHGGMHGERRPRIGTETRRCLDCGATIRNVPVGRGPEIAGHLDGHAAAVVR